MNQYTVSSGLTNANHHFQAVYVFLHYFYFTNEPLSLLAGSLPFPCGSRDSPCAQKNFSGLTFAKKTFRGLHPFQMRSCFRQKKKQLIDARSIPVEQQTTPLSQVVEHEWIREKERPSPSAHMAVDGIAIRARKTAFAKGSSLGVERRAANQ
jgi:hypothetical protein